LFFSPKVCGAIGVEDRNVIPDARMTASTIYKGFHPYLGRLNETRGYKAWSPKTKDDRTDYLQVDMGPVHFVCAVATQERDGKNEWSTSYKLHMSTDEVTWNPYRENNVEKVRANKLIDLIFQKQECFLLMKRFVRTKSKHPAADDVQSPSQRNP